MITQTESDLQEIKDRLNAINTDNQILKKKFLEILELMDTRVKATEDDITTIKSAISRIEIRYRGRNE